ncbi:MAG TPA: type II secretion system F family protein [Actinomycetota bacterium]|nr:type II secretion system F family protein [Actinomycetota bacterium]
MSELWLVVGLVGIFFSIFLTGVAIEDVFGERKRAVRLLESQVAGSSTEAAATRDRELSANFWERVLAPILAGAGRIAKRVTPLGSTERLAKKLMVAGSPPGWDAERVTAFKVIGFVAGLVGGFAFVGFVGLSGFTSIVVVALLTFVGFMAPDTIISRKAEERQTEILNSLSDTLDLLTISVEAGLSLNAAIAQVVHNVPGTLSQEFARMLQEIQLGVSRAEAFRHLAERTDVEELNAFTLAMIQADVFGVSIASVLRTQAQQLRIKRRQRAEQKAQQTPVKIVFPLILCILPALFVVIVGPGVIRIVESLFKS